MKNETDFGFMPMAAGLAGMRHADLKNGWNAYDVMQEAYSALGITETARNFGARSVAEPSITTQDTLYAGRRVDRSAAPTRKMGNVFGIHPTKGTSFENN